MPSKDTTTVETRLTKGDLERLKKRARQLDKTNAQLLRDIALTFLDREEEVEEDSYFVRRMRERDRDIAAALKSIESRFAVLIVRLGIDLESMYALAWSLTEGQPDRQELFEQCHQVGVKRFRRKLKDFERSMVDSLIHQDDQLKKVASRSVVEERE